MGAGELKRLRDWREQLSLYIEACRRTPLAYGTYDCGLFAAGAIAAMTGEDPAAAFRGRYASAAEAEALLASEGYTDLVDLVVSILPEIEHPAFAVIGDVMAFPGPVAGWSIGICVGERVAAIREDGAGLGSVGRGKALRAFRVPFGTEG